MENVIPYGNLGRNAIKSSRIYVSESVIMVKIQQFYECIQG